MIILADEYLKSGEAAKILHITVMTLSRWEKNGKLIPHHVDTANGYKYYTRQQLYDFNKMRYEKSNNTEELSTSQNVIENKSDVSNSTDDVIDVEVSDSSKQIEPLTVDAEEVENRFIPAKYHYFSTAKPVRKLTQICLNEMVRIPVGKTGYVDITLLPDTKIKLVSGDVFKPTIEHPTLFDLALIEGVISLKKAGNKVFSVSQLLRHLNGNSRNGCTDEKMAEVTERLRNMMGWRIVIDAREEFQYYKKLPSKTLAYMEGHLLDIVYLKTTTNVRGVYNEFFGFPVNGCFEIPKDKNVAITHEAYSETIGKLTCFPTKLLDVKGVKKTNQNKIIANYLLQRIQGLKNNKRGIHSILFETLQKDCELEKCTKQQMYNIREGIIKMLEHWKVQGHIKDYKLVKEKSGVYRSIEIEVSEEKKKKNVRNGTGRSNKVHTRKSANVPNTNG